MSTGVRQPHLQSFLGNWDRKDSSQQLMDTASIPTETFSCPHYSAHLPSGGQQVRQGSAPDTQSPTKHPQSPSPPHSVMLCVTHITPEIPHEDAIPITSHSGSHILGDIWSLQCPQCPTLPVSQPLITVTFTQDVSHSLAHTSPRASVSSFHSTR